MSSLDTAEPRTAAPGLASDLATFAVSALLPFVTGLFLLDAYVLIGFLGVFVALVCLLIAGVVWKGLNGGMIPTDPKVTHVVGLGVVAFLLGMMTLSLVT